MSWSDLPVSQDAETPWAHSYFGVHATVNAWLHLLFWWAEKTACRQSCSLLSSSQPYFCSPPPHLQFGFLLLVELLCLWSRMLWSSLSLIFDGVEGSLGAGGVGILGTSVGWALVAIWPWTCPFSCHLTLNVSLHLWGLSSLIWSVRALGWMIWVVPSFSHTVRLCAYNLYWFPVREQQCRYGYIWRPSECACSLKVRARPPRRIGLCGHFVWETIKNFAVSFWQLDRWSGFAWHPCRNWLRRKYFLRVWQCVYVKVFYSPPPQPQSNFKILLWKGNNNNLIQYPFFLFDSFDHNIS